MVKIENENPAAIIVPHSGFIIEDFFQPASDSVMGAAAPILLTKTVKSAQLLVHSAYFFVHIFGSSARLTKIPVHRGAAPYLVTVLLISSPLKRKPHGPLTYL
jgi:hypothetical protein